MLEYLALLSNGKSQGGHYLLNLKNGFLVTRYKWKALPMPTRINMMEIGMERRYPDGFEVMDRQATISPIPMTIGYTILQMMTTAHMILHMAAPTTTTVKRVILLNLSIMIMTP